MFCELLENDRAKQTAHAWTYCESALGIGHAVVALCDEIAPDDIPAPGDSL